MAEKKLKCQYCKNQDYKSNLTYDEQKYSKKIEDEFGDIKQVEGIRKKYYHQECKVKFDENKQIESDLFTYILKLLNIVDIPIEFIILLRKYKSDKKIDYNVILDAYKLSEGNIRYWIKRKESSFKNDMASLKYTWAIVKGNINKAHQQRNRENFIDKSKDKISNALSSNYYEADIKENKLSKRDELDISEFL